METRIVAQTPDIVIATSLHEALIESGIECQMASEGGSSVLPGVDSGDYAIIVSAADYDVARKLIDDLEAAADAIEAEDAD
jgi:hypothetical protein